MRNAVLDEVQAGIKIAKRNIKKYQVTPHLWQKVKRNKSLLMKVKEESGKADLKLNIQNMKIMASGPIIS